MARGRLGPTDALTTDGGRATGSALLLTHAPPGGSSGSAVRAAQTAGALQEVFSRVDVVSLARLGDESLAHPGVHLVFRVPVEGRRTYVASILRGGSLFAAGRAADLDAHISRLTSSGHLLPRYDLVVPHFAVMARAALRVSAGHRVIDLDMAAGAAAARRLPRLPTRRKRLLTRLDAAATRRSEYALCRRHDLVVVTSESEAVDLRRHHPRVEVVPNTTPDRGTLVKPFSERFEVLFVGTLDTTPNIEGVQFLCRQVVPLLREKVPGVAVRVVGRAPSPEVERACLEAAVTLTPNAPALEPHYEAARCVVAPLWTGGGSRIKLLEAMAFGSSVVATNVAMDGLALKPGDSALLAETADEFAAAIERCFREPGLCERLGSEARRAYEVHHHPESIRHRMTALLEPLRVA